MQKHRVLRNILVDILITGAALVVFALFHHVLPRPQQAVGITIPNPYATPAAEAEEEQPMLLASTGTGLVSDVGGAMRAAGGRNQRNNGRSQGSGQSGGASKGGSALTEETGETEAEADDTPIWEKFGDMYTVEVIQTENSYTSSDLAITVEEKQLDGGRITYYIADIYTSNITTFQTALASGAYGSGYRAGIADMAEAADALVAVNGDYYGNTNEGVVIRNGVIYRANPTDCDVCVLYYDGTMRVMPGSSFTVEDAIADGAWQAWTFGPSLLDANGQAISAFSSTRMITRANPRTAIGYYEPGHYCMIVVDGRGESEGITLQELSQLFEDLGCQAAYNLDGGNSSVMVWNGDVVNNPSGGGRASSDALLIAEVE